MKGRMKITVSSLKHPELKAVRELTAESRDATEIVGMLYAKAADYGHYLNASISKEVITYE